MNRNRQQEQEQESATPATPATPARAVIYLRVSTKRQEDEGTSLQSQEAGCRAFCDAQGLRVVDVVRDAASGASLDRPGLQVALDAIRNAQADTLVVYAYDRLARKENHQAVICYQVEEQHHGRVLSATEARDESLMGALMRTLQGYMAQAERAKILERTQRGMRQRVANGALLAGAVALYGYQWAEGRRAYLADLDAAPIVARIYQEAGEGRTMRGIAEGLTADGIPTPSQRHASTGGKRQVSGFWNGETIRMLLRNPTYKGEPLAYRWQTVKASRKDPKTGLLRAATRRTPAATPTKLPPAAAPALVTPAVWQAANDRLGLNQQEAGRSNKHPQNQLLRAGLAFCAYCGRMLYVNNNGARGHATYRYMCASRFGSRRALCAGGGPSVSCALLDADIWRKVVVVLNTDAVALALLGRAHEADGSGATDPAALEGLRARLAGFGGAIDQLAKLHKNLRRQQETAYDEEEFSALGERIAQASARLRALQEERDALSERLDGLVGATEHVADLLARMRLRVPMPAGAPKPGQPGFSAAFAASLERQVARERLAAVATMTADLTNDEKRTILRWLGVRVEVRRRDDTRPDGSQWDLILETPAGVGPFPLAGGETGEGVGLQLQPLPSDNNGLRMLVAIIASKSATLVSTRLP